jgi:hypothetical protein
LQGEWGPTSNFPNEGRDFITPQIYKDQQIIEFEKK